MSDSLGNKIDTFMSLSSEIADQLLATRKELLEVREDRDRLAADNRKLAKENRRLKADIEKSANSAFASDSDTPLTDTDQTGDAFDRFDGAHGSSSKRVSEKTPKMARKGVRLANGSQEWKCRESGKKFATGRQFYGHLRWCKSCQ